MKTIKNWEEYSRLPSKAKNAIDGFIGITNTIKARRYGLMALGGPAILMMMMIPVLYKWALWMGDSLIAGMGWFGAFVLVTQLCMWSSAVISGIRLKKKISKDFDIDVSNLDLMDLRMEYDRRMDS